MPLLPIRPVHSRLVAAFDWLVLFAVVAIPLFVLPFTPDPFGQPKVALLTLVVILAGILWLIHVVRRRSLDWVSDPAMKLLGLLVGVNIIAWAFSAERYIGLVGASGFEDRPLAQLLVLSVFAVLVSQLSERGRLAWLVRGLMVSGGVVSIVMVLKLLGVNLLRGGVFSSAAASLVGNSNTVVALVAALTVTVVLALLWRERSLTWRIISIMSGAGGLLTLVAFDHLVGWVALFVGVGLVSLTRLTGNKDRRLLPVVIDAAVLALGLLFFLLPTQSVTRVQPAVDVLLDRHTSAAVTVASLKHEPIFGRGPETFAFAFTQDRPRSANMTQFWTTRFLKANNELHQILVTTGFIGLVVFAALLVMVGGHLAHLLLHTNWREDAPWAPALAGGLAALAIASLFFPFSFLPNFLLFTLIGAVSGTIRLRRDAKPAKLSSMGQNLTLVGFALGIIVSVAVISQGGRVLAAEILYRQAAVAIGKNAELTGIIGTLNRAAMLNGREPKYFFTLAQAKLVQVQVGQQQTTPDTTALQHLLTDADDAVRKAVKTSPHSPETYEQVADLSFFAEQISGYDLSENILVAYETARRLEPNNPLHPLRIGQLLVRQVDSIVSQLAEVKPEEKASLEQARDERLQRAEVFFKRAADLKPDLAPASVGLAIVTERRGQTEEAIKRLQAVTVWAPASGDAWFELGRLLRGQTKNADALIAFTRVTQLNDQDAAAFFQIAELNEALGNKPAALAAYQRVNQLSPGNAQVQAKLTELAK